MMRKLFFLPLLALSFSLSAQTLFTYGDHTVSKNEFMRAYEKNNKLTSDDKDALQNYLNLYIIFKLKVQYAKDHMLDTLPSLQADLQSFKNQVGSNYIYDKAQLQMLMDQALQRSRKDIHVHAFYIAPVQPSDSLKAKKESQAFATALKKGEKADISSLEKAGLKVSAEDLGYITVFTLPWQVENIVYSLQPGKYSNPFHVDAGYYIFKNVSERPAAGKVKIAQILISAAPGDDASSSTAHRLADSLYTVLKGAGDFGELAKEFSNDRSTYMNGGEMPEFGVGKYVPEFTEQAFSLKNDGDISKPFKTDFGYHIIKRISTTPVPQKANEDYLYSLKQQLLNDSRIETAKDKLLATARVKTGFTEKQVNKENIYKVSDTSLVANKNITSGGVNQKTVLFTFNDKSSVTMQDWDQYIRNSGRVAGGQLHQSYDKLWPEFVKFSILKNYKKRLAEFDDDYAYQVKEFSDGNMLFEMMQKKVWTPAANDSAALAAYYEKHKEKYLWKKSADAIIFTCNNESTAQKCIDELKSTSWRKVMENHAQIVQADSGRFEYAQLPLNTNSVSEGIHPPVVNKFDGTASFVKVLKLYPEDMQRSFEQAKGLVIEDYQKLLEQQWVEQLKKIYPVKVNQKVLAGSKKR